MKVEVGQRVYVKKIGNEARYLDNKKAPIDEYISEAEVVTVARKYFTLKGFGVYLDGSRFFLDGGNDDQRGYISRYQVYLSKQDIYDEEEAKKLYHEIRRDWFDIGRCVVTLDQLRAIKAILEPSS